MKDDKIFKPCPFCGADDELIRLRANWNKRSKEWFVFVKCEMCHAQGRAFNSSEDPVESDWNNAACNGAIKAWNKRS